MNLEKLKIWESKTKLRLISHEGCIWEMPLSVISKHRAEYYKNVDNSSFEESYQDTLELFYKDEYEIKDWACNSMNWEDVMEFAKQVKPFYFDMQKVWTDNKDMEIRSEELIN